MLFFLSDSFSIFTPLKCDKATWTRMPGCCSPVSFLTAAVPLSLCLWVQDVLLWSGCHWAGVLVCLSVLPFYHSPLHQELVQLLCHGAQSHCWRQSIHKWLSITKLHALKSLVYLKQYFYRNSYHRAPVTSGYFCNMCATNWLPLAEER